MTVKMFSEEQHNLYKFKKNITEINKRAFYLYSTFTLIYGNLHVHCVQVLTHLPVHKVMDAGYPKI